MTNSIYSSPRPPTRSVNMTLAADPDLLQVLTSCVEQGAKAFGLTDRPALNLVLGAEELFQKFCTSRPGLTVAIEVAQMATAVRLTFSVRGTDLDLRAFNLVGGPAPYRDEDMEDLGLFLAARMVDDLLVQKEPGDLLRVSLVKERSYPAAPDLAPAFPGPVSPVTVRVPIPEELALFAQMQRSQDPRVRWPSFLQVPGQLADLVAGGECRALCAFGPRAELVGGIFWKLVGRSAEAWGPFVFGQGENSPVAAALLEAAVGELAQGQVVGLLFLDAPEPFPAGAAESIGDLRGEDGRLAPARFRLLQEDPGSVAWVHPVLEPWLRAECARNCLPREIRSEAVPATHPADHSVFFSRLRKSHGQAELWPVRDGRDLAANLGAHLARFSAERLTDVRCWVDLGEAWQAGFMPALVDAGFEPRLLLPYRGRGDEVLFQRVAS